MNKNTMIVILTILAVSVSLSCWAKTNPMVKTFKAEREYHLNCLKGSCKVSEKNYFFPDGVVVTESEDKHLITVQNAMKGFGIWVVEYSKAGYQFCYGVKELKIAFPFKYNTGDVKIEKYENGEVKRIRIAKDVISASNIDEDSTSTRFSVDSSIDIDRL